MGSTMWQRSIGTRPYFNAGAALRLIDLAQDAVQLILGNAGDLVLYVFAFHGGNSFQFV